jgi:protein SCO1/2
MPAFAMAGNTAPSADFTWTQHPGAELPRDLLLRDENGRQVMLASLLTGSPMILDLDYYHCPSLCGVVRSDLFDALGASGLKPGADYTILSLSIDPAETPRDASQAKVRDLTQAAFLPSGAVHYLTGPAATIAAVASTVGFHDRYDPRFKQFLHPAGLVILTPSGRVSSYLLGVGYHAGDLRAALLRAADNGIARAALPILLVCFHFDSTTGRYTLAIVKLLRLLGVITILSIVSFLMVLNRTKAANK